VTTTPIALLGVIGGLLLALVAAYAPGLLFAAYLLIPAFYKGGLQPYSPVDITVLLAVLNGLQIIPVAIDRRRRHVSNAGILLWGVLAVLILAGATYARDQPLALSKIASWWAFAFLPILPAALRVGSESRYIRQFVWSLAVLGLPMVILGLGQLSGTERLALLGVDPIAVSRAVLLVPLLSIAFILRQPRRLPQLIAIILTPPAFLVALGSGSRGPLLVLLVMVPLILVTYFTRSQRVRPRMAAVVAGLGLVTVLVLSVTASRLPDVSLERFTLLDQFVQSAVTGDLSTSVGDTSSGTRLELFGVAIRLFEEQPILGVGPGGFETFAPSFLGPAEHETYPHNALLQIAAELGIFGVGIFVLLTALALVRRLPAEPSSLAVRATFVYFLLNAMISRGIYEDRTMWGLMMLMLLIESPAGSASSDGFVAPIRRIGADLIRSRGTRKTDVGGAA
jgi:O-antigen ligase